MTNMTFFLIPRVKTGDVGAIGQKGQQGGQVRIEQRRIRNVAVIFSGFFLASPAKLKRFFSHGILALNLEPWMIEAV